MRFFILFLASLIILTSCSSRYLPQRAPSESESISSRYLNINLPPHKGQVDIFLPSESVPDSMILPIRIVEVSGRYNGYEALLLKMKETARLHGYDGVLILDREIISESFDGGSVISQIVTGIGFIYKHSLDRTGQVLKEVDYEIMSEDGWQPMGIAHMTQNEKVKSFEASSEQYQQVYDSVYRHLDHRMIVSAGGEGWFAKETRHTPLYSEVNLQKRKYTVTGDFYKVEQSNIKYRPYGGYRLYTELTHIYKDPQQITFATGTDYKLKFEFDYDEHMLKKVSVFKQNREVMIQEFSTSNQLCTQECIWYQLDKEGNKIPVIRQRFHYYTPADFNPSLQFAPDIPMRATTRPAPANSNTRG
ncbi:MAG: hypothetical protein AB8F95_15410 [Bacteroidia bacterium]